MRKSSLILCIPAVFLGIIFSAGLSLVFAEEITEKETTEKSKMEEFEKKLEKLSEDFQKVIEDRAEEKQEMTELKEKLNQLTRELSEMKGKPGEEEKEIKTSYETDAEISPETPSDEHLYFEGLGLNENLPERVVSLDKLRVGFWVQQRLMYNASNIPGPANTNFGNTKNYDFLRQRARLGIDIRPLENVGGYVQLEYRSGLGVGPDISDPREGIDFDNIAFNRLDDRGLRYAYFYASPIKEATFVAGIIPSSDYLGDTQFSADWDFNVGGVALTGEISDFTYRLSYLRLIDGLGFNIINELGEDAHLILADFTTPFFNEATRVGLHVYYILNDIDEPSVGDFQEAWIGVSGRTEIGLVGLNGFFVLNVGEFDQPTSLPSGLTIPEGSHQGVAFKGEGVVPLTDLPYGPLLLSGLFIFATGDEEGKMDNRFNTIEGLVGTEGYWAYTHIFTANGPSDVNDFGLDIGNTRLGSGAGLLTAQVKLNLPLHRLIRLELESGSFWSAKKRAGANYMGTEVGGMFTFPIVRPLNVNIGFAYARLGNFFESLIAEDQQLDRNIYELFSRIQLEF
ncbi:MAG TPA: hypothetical protein VNN20_02190 [Thermodesulfobacteriota bacterium]|nr:hypothetical protein [Thermodesulfobacteriota bacterium]